MSETYQRHDQRAVDQLRPISFQNNIAPHATGSTLIEWGDTRVICGVSIEESVPRWMQSQGVEGGWITAEYSMLPYSTLDRKRRDVNKGKLDGRSTEIQRLIGRSLRAGLDLKKLGSRTVWIDCDVLQADGGTRTASITGAYVALSLAVNKLINEGKLLESPFLDPVAAVSVGVVEGTPLLDLCYVEDVAAEVDMNLVMTTTGKYIEVQGTGEEATFSADQLNEMLALGRTGVEALANCSRKRLPPGNEDCLSAGFTHHHGEAEEAVGWVLEKVFEQTPSVFTHPENSGPILSVYLGEKQRVTEAHRHAVQAGLEAVAEGGLEVGAGQLEVKRLRREDWVDSWKRHFKPIDIQGKLLLKPSWRNEKAKSGQKVVILDPGLSFGTGQHATTKFCLRQLVALRETGQPQSLLDVGTGSGILSIAAAKLGYRPVQAFDYDSEAVRVARRNATKNRVEERVQLKIVDVTQLPLKARVKHDVVCANLFYDLLIANAERLIARVKPDGALVLAGIVDTQFAEVQAAFEARGMRLHRTQRQGEWRSGRFVQAD